MRPDGSVVSLRAYELAGGYQAIRKVLRTGMTPMAVTEEVKEANLRGRGGAGFQTGVKWSFVPCGKDVPNPTYLVVNGDEMEPGTFKDRLLMEQDPHQLIEGAMVAAFAIEADIAYIFLRGEYTLAAERLARAIAEAYERQYLGKNIFGSGYSLELYLHLSGGRYICGEETGLLNALEGKRANPDRSRRFRLRSDCSANPRLSTTSRRFAAYLTSSTGARLGFKVWAGRRMVARSYLA